MNDLRLIILVIGLCVIALIYFWETRKQRKEQRRQTVSYVPPEHEMPELTVKAEGNGDTDYASVITDLNEALNETRQHEDEVISKMLNITIDDPRTSNTREVPVTPPVTGDLFPNEKSSGQDGQGRAAAPEADAAGVERIITLFVTAPDGIEFSANDIVNAARETGLEFGDLNIFHHFGNRTGTAAKAVFSMADMFEPGSFDPDDMPDRTTRGLSLFMCLPTPVKDTRAFELMLNTARQLAEILGGQVMGPDRKILNKEHIRSIYKIINAKA